MNTWGLHSINSQSFNVRWGSTYTYPEGQRNSLVTLFRIQNLTLNILGYIPIVSLYSGCARNASGVGLFAVTLAVGERNARSGAII